MIVDKIIQHYNTKSLTEKLSGKNFNPIRGSNSGKCVRQIAYAYHGYQGEPIKARGQMVFRLGNLVEQDMVDVCKEIKELNLRDEQKEVSVEIDGHKIEGHIDGIVTIKNSYEEELDAIVDFKSCSDFAFKDAEKGHVDKSYIAQMHFYMKALNMDLAILVYYKKHTSHLCEVLIHWDDAVWAEIDWRFSTVFQSTKECLPEGEYFANEKGNLPWQCSYCSYVGICKPSHSLSFDKKGKPILTENIPN